MRPPFDFSAPVVRLVRCHKTHVPASEHLDKVLGKQNNARLRGKNGRAIKETEAAGCSDYYKEAILLRNNNC